MARGPGRMAPPVAGRAMVVRARLVERLAARWTQPLTVVSAPAGFGKTTLLSQTVASNELAAMGVDFWLSCGSEDAVASVFGDNLCCALGAPDRLSTDVALGDLAAGVVDAMWQRSPQQVALVIDDVQEIPADSESAALLAAVLDRLPGNGHIVLSSRQKPPVPVARFELEDRVAYIGEGDLSFTESEMADFAALRGVADDVVAESGGWPALAELFARARDAVAEDYIGEEVLSDLPEADRRDLALLAHLDGFDEALARAALGHDVDVAGLVANLPLVTIAADSTWKLHSLWRSLLADRVTAAEIAKARRRAGLLTLERDRPSSAVRLLIEAEAWDELTDAVTVALGAAYPPVARDVLTQWLNLLPDDVRASPTGQLLVAVLATESRTDDAWGRFESCAAAFRDLGHTTGELTCLVQIGQLAWWSERPEGLIAGIGRTFELEAAGCEEAVPLACLGRAFLFDMTNDSHKMLAELRRIPPGALNEAWQGIVKWAEAIGLLQLGLAKDAQRVAEQALTYAGSMHAPLAVITLLQAKWYQGKIREVLGEIPQIAQRTLSTGYGSHTAVGAAQCSWGYAMQGQIEAASDYLAQAQAAAAGADAPLVDTSLTIAKATLLVATGNEPTARDELTAYVNRHPIDQGLPAAPQRRHLALLYVLVPSSRPLWERAELGPAFRLGRDLARALTAVREEGALPPGTSALDRADLIQAHLPLDWVAELAVAAVAADRDDGWQLLDQTWPATRDKVRDLTVSPTPSLRKAAGEVLKGLAVPPSSRLELCLLGSVQLFTDGSLVKAPDWRRERVRGLLAYLVLNGSANRQQLADDLWPTLGRDAQSRNLRVTLTYLLRVLEPQRARGEASFFIRQNGSTVSLYPGKWLTVDVWGFDTLCDRAMDADRHGAPAAALEHGRRAVALWRGEPDEVLSEPWAVAAVEQRRVRFASLAIRTGELSLAQGDTKQALTLAEQALTMDPWLEAAHRLVLACHHGNSDRRAVRRAIDRYRRAIDDLGIDPEEATVMVERLLADQQKVR